MTPLQMTGITIVSLLVGTLFGWLVGIGDVKRKEDDAYNEGHSVGYKRGVDDGTDQGYARGVEFGHAHPLRDEKGHFQKLVK